MHHVGDSHCGRYREDNGGDGRLGEGELVGDGGSDGGLRGVDRLQGSGGGGPGSCRCHFCGGG